MTVNEFIEILKNPPAHHLHVDNLGETILFENIDFDYFQINIDFATERHIKFKNVSINNFTLKGLKTKGTVTFEDVKSTVNSFNFIEIEAKQLVFSGNSEFNGGLNIQNCILDFLAFNYITFTYHVVVKKCIIRETILSADFYAIFFQEENKLSFLRAYGGIISELHISNGNINYLGIYGPIILKNTFISKGKFGMIFIDSLGLEKFNLKNPEDKHFELEVDALHIKNVGKSFISIITNLILNRLRFEDLFSSKESIISLYNININFLEFSNFINYGQINLNNVGINGIISFLNSDVGKLTFISCNFLQSLIDFKKSKIIETFIIGCEFPKKFTNSNHLDQIEAFSQIKKIYENRGSQKDALDYYSLEMNALNDSIPLKGNFWEKVNLWMNKISTNHGVNWQKGLASTLCVSAIFYLLYVILTYNFR